MYPWTLLSKHFQHIMQSTIVHNCSVMGALAVKHTFRVIAQSILTSRAGFAIFDKSGRVFIFLSVFVRAGFFLKQCSNCTNICIVNVANRIISCVERMYWYIHNKTKSRHAASERRRSWIIDNRKNGNIVESQEHYFNAKLYDAGRN